MSLSLKQTDSQTENKLVVAKRAGVWGGKNWEFGISRCKLCVCAKSLSRVRLFVTPWAVAHQAPLSMEFSRQEYWSGLPFLTPLYVISKVFSCILQENQGELRILHLVWNWNADGF